MPVRPLRRPQRLLPVLVGSLAAVISLALAALLLPLGGEDGSPPEAGPSSIGEWRGAVSSPPGTVFGPDSVWRLKVDDAPVDPQSAAMVRGLTEQVKLYNGNAAFNVEEFNSSFFIAEPETPRIDVEYHDCQDKGYTPDLLYEDALGAHFRSVAMPTGARPSPGTDGHLTVWSPSTDQLWEFWQAERRPDGWYACWGGRIDDVSTNPGFFPDGTGASATGLAYAGGMIGVLEAQAGQIEHALALQAPDLENYDIVSWPAQRSDGYNPDGEPHRIPEGRRLRLRADVDVDALDLHPIAAAVARTAQTYGFIVTDKAGSVSVVAEGGEATSQATGEDPWDALLGGTQPYDVMAGFPWSQLEVLPHDYGKPAA